MPELPEGGHLCVLHFQGAQGGLCCWYVNTFDTLLNSSQQIAFNYFRPLLCCLDTERLILGEHSAEGSRVLKKVEEDLLFNSFACMCTCISSNSNGVSLFE